MRYILCFIVALLPCVSKAQKLYVVPNINLQYSGLSYVTKAEAHASDFIPSVPKINGSYSIDIIYHPKNLTHKLTLDRNILGQSFGIKSKYFEYPNNATLGPRNLYHSDGIEQFILSYNIGLKSKKVHNPIEKIKVIYTGSFGLGIGFNRNQAQYDWDYNSFGYGSQGNDAYIVHKGTITKKGLGSFAIINIGLDVPNRRGESVFSFSFFYNQGFTQMVKYNIHYQYGFFTDPDRQVDVPNQVLRSRGTSFGLKVGAPIRILKQHKKHNKKTD